ncbi:MAG: MFS transporter, partial [Stellaceae bacterium]
MLVLIATLAIQALATLMVLAPPVFAGLAAPDFGVSANHIGVFTAVVYAAACLSTGMSGGPVRRYGAIRVSQAALLIGAAGLALLA